MTTVRESTVDDAGHPAHLPRHGIQGGSAAGPLETAGQKACPDAMGSGALSVVASPTASLRLSATVLRQTFDTLRGCGRGRTECQVLWVGPWNDPTVVTDVVHPVHRAHRGGFVVDDAWLTGFWQSLATRAMGIRAQVHTHPGEAFHSATDDAWPIVHVAGFLSLVIPDFALGPVSLVRSYLAEIGRHGAFHEVDPVDRLDIGSEP